MTWIRDMNVSHIFSGRARASNLKFKLFVTLNGVRRQRRCRSPSPMRMESDICMWNNFTEWSHECQATRRASSLLLRLELQKARKLTITPQRRGIESGRWIEWEMLGNNSICLSFSYKSQSIMCRWQSTARRQRNLHSLFIDSSAGTRAARLSIRGTQHASAEKELFKLLFHIFEHRANGFPFFPSLFRWVFAMILRSMDTLGLGARTISTFNDNLFKLHITVATVLPVRLSPNVRREINSVYNLINKWGLHASY